MATVGDDIQPYLDRFGALGIGPAGLKRIAGQFTAQAFITTDLDDNQIIAFHPGAMDHSHHNVIDGSQQAKLAIIGPDGKEGMLSHARQCREHGIPFIFDPGQGLPMFDGAQLRELVDAATAVAVNDYESAMLCERTGWTEAQVAARVKALIVTRGGEGSDVYVDASHHRVQAASIAAAVDPTGCGDAYRGGLLYGLANGWDWVAAARLGSVLGAIKIEHQGPQNHVLDRDEVARRYRETYGQSPF